MTAPAWLTPKPALIAVQRILEAAFSDGQYAAVHTKLPAKDRPERFVVVTRIGGGQTNQAVDICRVLVECYARVDEQAERMTGTSSAALRNAASTWKTINDRNDPGGTQPPPERIWVRGYGNETGLAKLNNPDVLTHEKWQFIGELSVAVNR